MYIYIYIYNARVGTCKHVCTVSTRSWVRIPLGPTFYIESKNLSSNIYIW